MYVRYLYLFAGCIVTYPSSEQGCRGHRAHALERRSARRSAVSPLDFSSAGCTRRVAIVAMSPDYLVLGATGYFGSHAVKWLQAKGKSYTTSSVRIENREELQRVLDDIKPKYVLCFAGVAGRPNIDWCETHRVETIRANVLAQLNVADACFTRGIHCTLIGTGSLYTYDQDHPLGSGAKYKEEDPPNFQGNFYVRMRILLEQLIREFPNVLNLRVLYPVSDDFHARSVPAKLTKYAKVVNIPSSFSVLDDLWPALIEMPVRGLTGNFNFTNPGTLDQRTILTLYKEYIDENFIWVEASDEEVKELQKAPRPFCELDVSKLLAHFPDIPPIQQSIRQVFQRIKASQSAAKVS
eukprot:tig00020553_g10653.t1